MRLDLTELDGGSLHRIHDIALRILDGELTLDDAISVWLTQPDWLVNAKIRSWHSDLLLKVVSRKWNGLKQSLTSQRL